MRDAWFWNHVLGLSLSMVALCAPGPLEAWTQNTQSANPSPTDFYSSSTTQEDAHTEAASLFSESPFTSQGHRLHQLSSTAGHLDAVETQTVAERSSSSLESTSLTTEPLSSTHSDGTGRTQSSEGTPSSTHTDQLPVDSPVVSWEPRVWTWTESEDSSLLRDSPDSTLRLEDVTDLNSQTAINTDSAYTSTTMSRAGERTYFLHLQHGLFSTNCRDRRLYTHYFSAQNRSYDTKPQTDSYRETYSEMRDPMLSTGTETLTNSTENEQTFTSQHSTSQTELLVSSTPPMLSPAILTTNVSTTNRETSYYYETSTEVSTEVHSVSTQKQEGTEGVPSRTEDDLVDFSLTTAAPTGNSRTDDFLTEMPALVTDIFPTTTPVTVTERPQLQDEATSPAAVSTTSVPPVSLTSTSKLTTTHSTASASQTQATISKQYFLPKHLCQNNRLLQLTQP
ncbi:hypothetical protein WMY93_002951 [Mugilogobius chulae]|uniref:Uncharacterized protein n=1 Tax=Mugilogobius chulae TaxID=88201 RepID=A0AAW0PW30_9GOBI